MISSPTFILDDGNTGRITLYGFESAEAASRLMDATRQQVNCPGLPPFQLPEEVYDGFDDNGSIRVMWDLTDVHTLGGSPVPEGQADAAFTVLTRSIATTRYAGTDFGGESSSAQIWEQHGPIVVLAATSGFCCSYGFSNNEGITDAPASMPTLIAGMDVIRPIILENLRARGLIPA